MCTKTARGFLLGGRAIQVDRALFLVAMLSLSFDGFSPLTDMLSLLTDSPKKYNVGYPAPNFTDAFDKKNSLFRALVPYVGIVAVIIQTSAGIPLGF